MAKELPAQSRKELLLLLHSSGMDAQDVYWTLKEPASSSKEEANEYERAIRILDCLFTPQIIVRTTRISTNESERI